MTDNITDQTIELSHPEVYDFFDEVTLPPNYIKSAEKEEHDNIPTKKCGCCGHELPLEFFENGSDNCYIC